MWPYFLGATIVGIGAWFFKRNSQPPVFRNPPTPSNPFATFADLPINSIVQLRDFTGVNWIITSKNNVGSPLHDFWMYNVNREGEISLQNANQLLIDQSAIVSVGRK